MLTNSDSTFWKRLSLVGLLVVCGMTTPAFGFDSGLGVSPEVGFSEAPVMSVAAVSDQSNGDEDTADADGFTCNDGNPICQNDLPQNVKISFFKTRKAAAHAELFAIFPPALTASMADGKPLLPGVRFVIERPPQSRS